MRNKNIDNEKGSKWWINKCPFCGSECDQWDELQEEGYFTSKIECLSCGSGIDELDLPLLQDIDNGMKTIRLLEFWNLLTNIYSNLKSEELAGKFCEMHTCWDCPAWNNKSEEDPLDVENENKIYLLECKNKIIQWLDGKLDSLS